MILTKAVKLQLIDRFLPMLYLDRNEADYPVSPAEYAENAALWKSAPPNHSKSDWGLASGSARVPLIPRGGISLDPAHDVEGGSDPDGDGVPEFYLGHADGDGFPYLSAQGHELWLDYGGWQDGSSVDPTTQNRRSSGRNGAHLEQPWYSADVWTMETLRGTMGRQAFSDRFGIGPEDESPQLAGLVVIAYHFLFPLHRQARKLTAHANESDPYSGDYEGDWSTFAVVASGPEGLNTAVTADGCIPRYAAFGQRWKSTSPDYRGDVAERMVLKLWSEVLSTDDHAVIVAAPGTHNLYPHDEPTNPDGTITPQWIDLGLGASEPANALVQDSVEQPAARLFSLKVIVGLGFLGPIGVAIGAVAAAAESDVDGLYEEPKLGGPPTPSPDDPLAEDASDIEKDKVATPASVSNVPLIDASQAEVRHWQPSASEALIDDSLLLQHAESGGRIRFLGGWGVRCTNDPLAIRSGLQFPAYRIQVVDALLRYS